LLAGGYYFAVPNNAGGIRVRLLQVSLFDLCLNARRVNTLNAERALFHDAAAADRHIGIAQRLETRRLVVREQHEVEAPYLVWTVVQAVPRSDAAVVNHHVDAFRRVRRRSYRAHRL